MEIVLRDAVDADSEGVIALVARVYAEYPGCVLDVDSEEPELRSPASSFDRFWVLERDREIVGTVALRDGGGSTVRLEKLYLDRGLRGRGHAGRLLDAFEAAARERGARRIELWSDTRFDAAHRFYERNGFRDTGRTRELFDLSRTTERHFVKTW